MNSKLVHEHVPVLYGNEVKVARRPLAETVRPACQTKYLFDLINKVKNKNARRRIGGATKRQWIIFFDLFCSLMSLSA